MNKFSWHAMGTHDAGHDAVVKLGTAPACLLSCLLVCLLLGALALAQDLDAAVSVRAVAEIESKSTKDGREIVRLIPADRVVPGDRVIYTLEVRNSSSRQLDTPSVSHRVPEHMQYVAESAVGPAATVSYSVDGGRSFGRPANLTMPTSDGGVRAAVAADYTDIRWRLKNPLKPNSVAFVRFRAVVK